MFFALANRITRAVLSDTNRDLVTTYRVVKTRLDELLEQLGEHERKHGESRRGKGSNGQTYYRRIRQQSPDDPVEIAARFIYLNKTCYNGLYRVNSSGKFNVPEGSYSNPDICNENRLRKASGALSKATIEHGDFADVVKPGHGDWVYCDPPYDGCFTAYQAAGFSDDSQERLRDSALAWSQNGASVVLSNADTSAMRKLYESWTIHDARAPRSINSNGNGRGSATELVITNG